MPTPKADVKVHQIGANESNFEIALVNRAERFCRPTRGKSTAVTSDPTWARYRVFLTSPQPKTRHCFGSNEAHPSAKNHWVPQHYLYPVLENGHPNSHSLLKCDSLNLGHLIFSSNERLWAKTWLKKISAGKNPLIALTPRADGRLLRAKPSKTIMFRRLARALVTGGHHANGGFGDDVQRWLPCSPASKARGVEKH